MKLDRLLAITVMMINRKKITAKELAEHFEVSVRTIHRDIEAINQAGIPVVSYQGTNGGFGIMENYKLDRQVLTSDDILSIMTALKGISTTLNDKNINSTMEKIRGLVPDHEAGRLRNKNEQIIVDFSPWGCSASQKEKISIIRRAIEDNKVIRFCYTNSRGETIHREVEPMSIAFKGYSWYIYGYCRTRCGFRFFRLTRVKDLKVGNEKFLRREMSYEDFSAANDWSTGKRIVHLVLRFRPEARGRVEDFYEAALLREESDGSFSLTVSFPEDEWVYGHILSFGDDVEVLEPDYMREIIKEKGRRIWEKYGARQGRED